MRARKPLIVIAVIALCGVVFAGTAIAGGTRTNVSIEAQQGGFFGFVSSKKQKCEAGRKVVLYKQKGGEQQPREDKKIGHDIAQPNGPDSMWSINTDKSGKFYAKAVETSSCHKAFSETVHSQ